jgi:DNA repair exonuclease SbcCD nuclease subunit
MYRNRSRFTPADRRGTFDRIASLAARHDLLIIAGDLFDSPDPDAELVDHVSRAVKSLQTGGIPTVIIPGPAERIAGGCPALEKLGAMVLSEPEFNVQHIETRSGMVHVYSGLLNQSELPPQKRGPERVFISGSFTPPTISTTAILQIFSARKTSCLIFMPLVICINSVFSKCGSG